MKERTKYYKCIKKKPNEVSSWISYPRSQKTVNEIKKSNKEFIKFYGNSILGNTSNYYSISKNNTKTNYRKYINFLIKNKLPFKKINNLNYFSNKIEGSILTSEKTLNYNKIYQNIYQKIKVRKNIILKKKQSLLKRI